MSLQAGTENAYGAATRALGTPRTVEYRVFSQVTGQLTHALQPDRPFSELAAALHANQNLWTALLIDLTAPGNELPDALRARLVGLARFVAEHSRKVLRREADAQILIDVNTAIMRGLRGQLPDGAEV